MMIDDTDDVDEDINGIQHLFDEWNESKFEENSGMSSFFIYIYTNRCSWNAASKSHPRYARWKPDDDGRQQGQAKPGHG